MDAKIRMDDVVKIFGRKHRGRPLEMLMAGANTGEIRETTGHVVGVAGVSLSVQEGEVFVVMGLSGSGKSTLIRCINRIHEPTAGAVFIDGQDVTSLTDSEMREVRRRKLAMVFQHFALFPHKTVLDNVAYGLKVQGVDLPVRHERAMETLELVGLADWATRYPNSLSGGMQQRVGLARALAPDPDVLLMDEAFSALDPLIRRQMQNELLLLQERVRKTIIFITHDLNEALRVGSRVMIMKEGRAIQIGTPTQIVTHPENEYVAEFMADIDHAKVLPASYVMKRPPMFDAEASAADVEVAVLECGVGYVVDASQRPVSVVTPTALAAASGRVGAVAKEHFACVSPSTPLAALFRLAGQGVHIAVLDVNGCLIGAVSPIDILTVLGRVEVLDDPRGEAIT